MSYMLTKVHTNMNEFMFLANTINQMCLNVSHIRKHIYYIQSSSLTLNLVMQTLLYKVHLTCCIVLILIHLNNCVTINKMSIYKSFDFDLLHSFRKLCNYQNVDMQLNILFYDIWLDNIHVICMLFKDIYSYTSFMKHASYKVFMNIMYYEWYKIYMYITKVSGILLYSTIVLNNTNNDRH